MFRRLPPKTTKISLTITSSKIESKVRQSLFHLPATQAGLTQARRFYSTDKIDKTVADMNGSHQITEQADSINRSISRVDFIPVVYDFLCIYNKCKEEPTYRAFLKQSKIDNLKLPDYSIENDMIVTKPPVSVFELRDLANTLLNQDREFIEQHQVLYEQYFKNLVEKLQKDAEDKQPSIQLKQRWKNIQHGGKLFMSACMVVGAQGAMGAKVLGRDDYSPKQQQELENMAQIMKDMDIFMRSCLVLTAPGSKGILISNEETKLSTKATIKDFFESNTNSIEHTEQNTTPKRPDSESFTNPKQGIVITGSPVTINYYVNAFEKHIIFLILAGTCGALLYWYFSKTKVDDAITTPLPEPVKPITNVPAPYEHYQKSHWSNALEKKIDELSASTEPGYPVKVAVTGIPGSGKTDLAKNYAHKRHIHGSSIVWSIVVETQESLWEGYKSLAAQLNINTSILPGEKEDACHKRVRFELNQKLFDNPGWTLILDNVVDYCEIKDYIPENGNGVVVFTSCCDNLLDVNNSINISEGLDDQEAVSLLNKVTGLSDSVAASALAETLENLPLNLMIAAKIIKNSQNDGPDYKWNYTTYNKHIKNSPVEIIEEEQTPEAKKLNYKKSKPQLIVIRDAINQLDDNAKELLIFCSHIFSSRIKRNLLEDYIREQDKTSSDDIIRHKCSMLLAQIQKFSLLQQIPNKASYNIHRVTQQVGRKKNIPKEQANRIFNAVLLRLPSFSLDIDYDDLESKDTMKTCLESFSHMLTLEGQKELLQIIDQELSIKLFYYMGKARVACGNYTYAVQHFKDAFEIARKNYNYTDFRLAIILDNLGLAYNYLGEAKNAEESLQSSLKIIQKHYNDKHWRVAITLSNLGIVYIHTDKLNLARKNLEHAIAIMPKPYAMNDYKAAEILDTMGLVCIHSGQPKDALNYLLQALSIRKNYYGTKHIKTATTLNNLGIAYTKLNQFEDAKNCLEEALSTREEISNYSDWWLAGLRSNLGPVYTNLGMYKQAEKMLEIALPIMEGRFGSTHHWVAEVQCDLGLAYSHLGKFKQAKDALEQAFPIIEKHDVPGYFDIPKIASELIKTYNILGETHKAAELRDRIDKLNHTAS